MAKSSSNKHWLIRQQKDPYVKQAQQSHYRSRAVYKLIEIDEKDHLFKQGQTIIDLGAAPGSWSQYVSKKIGKKGRLIAIDILPMDPIANTLFIKGDFTEQPVVEQCLQAMNHGKADLVISDMAPNLSGIGATDQARSLNLAELSLDLAKSVLKQGGHMLVKLFEGEGTGVYRRELKEHFGKVIVRKPKASRDDSREFYILARTFRL
ncbi:MAG: RlmE family RNA methyltransferase [Proteobacteria bacterium]|nr:RlmE family RNA methyltransferase [Pseudomonadota bacterium]